MSIINIFMDNIWYIDNHFYDSQIIFSPSSFSIEISKMKLIGNLFVSNYEIVKKPYFEALILFEMNGFDFKDIELKKNIFFYTNLIKVD